MQRNLVPESQNCQPICYLCKVRIGIIFGGPSREREISFAGGRTVYDNLDKTLFEAIPVFVDSLGRFILLDWQYIYKGTIRDFYPPAASLPASKHGFQIYIESLGQLSDSELEQIAAQVGRPIQLHQFKDYFDLAFLTLHGPYGEDGNIQGLLEWYNIPYTGSGILPSAIGIDKVAQRTLLQTSGFRNPKVDIINAADWEKQGNREQLFDNLKEKLGLPLVIKAPHQGSSIGVSIVRNNSFTEFEAAVEKSFFKKTYRVADWNKLNLQQKVQSLRQLVDIREGIGMPVLLQGEEIFHPEELLQKLEEKLSANEAEEVILTNVHNEAQVLVESFISGKEFSCIVVQNEAGEPVALPPTEIIKGNDVFDYRSKYLPGLSRKVTPIDLPVEQIREIRKDCERLFKAFNFNVYARLDGFITAGGEVFLNDPNTTSGMLPSSFFFHQAAEIGLNPSQFLTYIIRTSLAERIKSGKQTHTLRQLLAKLDTSIDEQHKHEHDKVRVAVIMGGYSSERHISVESGRNIYEKLSSSAKYEPVPVFLTGNAQEHKLYQIPVNMMLKDNADDIKERIEFYENGGGQHPVLQEITTEAAGITAKYTNNAICKPQLLAMSELPELVDVVFIALHGRPGEDGALQAGLEKFNIPYNGSGVESSRITINKFETNEILAAHGIPVAKHRMVSRQDWDADKETLLNQLEGQFGYPLIAKPADDGCSSAVKKIKTRAELEAFARMIFRPGDDLLLEEAKTLALGYKEEFPCKMEFLVEELIGPNGAKHFLEITGGLLTRKLDNGEVEYEIFEASEALASGEVLSLEEKFLAGEGQNITPARYAPDPETRQFISDQVKEHLKQVAQVLNVEGYARIDAFVRVYDDNRAETIIIEINSLPGMTPATCIFHQTSIQGYKPYDFIDGILEYGMKRKKDMAN